MAEIDAELIERVTRWCAEAGRQAPAAEIRRALAGLTWDHLIAVRALLADPPPARPLGPFALADLARGAPPDLAAEREREGRYRSEDAGAGEPPSPPPRSRSAARPAKRRGPLIRRAGEVPAPSISPPPRTPPIEELFRPEGRAVVERLVRRHGARRTALSAALSAGWRRDDGAPPGEDELSRLLDHHGLVRAFERRERDDLLHELRAAGGVRSVAAARVGLDPERLDAALERLGASADAEAIRERRRAGLRVRATLSERVRLLLGDEERLGDLGILAEFEDDLRARLPEHLRALRTAREPLAVALGRSLSATLAQVRTLALRFGLDLGERVPARPRPAGAPPGTGGHRRAAPRGGGPPHGRRAPRRR